MRYIYLILCILLSLPITAQYRITRAKVAGWGMCAVGGAADGLLEGYEFDGRKSFERKYGVNKYGYFGSESWRKVYIGGKEANGFKSPLHQVFGASDFYHHADDLRKIGYISGSVIIGINGHKTNTKRWYYIIDFATAFTLSAITKTAAMQWIRS